MSYKVQPYGEHMYSKERSESTPLVSLFLPVLIRSDQTILDSILQEVLELSASLVIPPMKMGKLDSRGTLTVESNLFSSLLTHGAGHIWSGDSGWCGCLLWTSNSAVMMSELVKMFQYVLLLEFEIGKYGLWEEVSLMLWHGDDDPLPLLFVLEKIRENNLHIYSR